MKKKSHTILRKELAERIILEKKGMVNDLKKRYVLFAMVCCLSLMVFVGCGNKSDDNQDSTVSPSVEDSTNMPDPTGSDALDDVENGVDDVIDGAEDAVDDAADGVKDAADDATGNNNGTTKK